MTTVIEKELELDYIKDLIKRIKLTKGGCFPLEEVARDIAALEKAGMTREEIAEAIDDNPVWIDVVLENFAFNHFRWVCREHIPQMTDDQKTEARRLVAELVKGGNQ
jgi:hypothetical protein